MVKENLLKKVGQFIRLTEEQQLELRKHTSYINGLINKIENKRKLDFSRFDAETMEVALEDIKRFSDLQKKHSLA
jgi:NAD-dependent DNA ligase